MENMYQISQDADEYADSIAMDLIRKGREEAREEARKLIEEERKKVIEVRKLIEKERTLLIEARKKEVEARKKEVEARKKAETEKKNAIRNMLKDKKEKENIAEFLGLTLKKLNTYIKEIEKEDKALKSKKK